ncbi:probable disease resistance protein At1g12290 [Hibiscus syriacus]|uniref:probable disease resistance protein At1g12290 n=1 Tax=Hibiscus syriacus TaxID=106335 RepID=UPI001921ED91|nr:probable disease resistance protein At1g12290 [Hibiscus syriacus]
MACRTTPEEWKHAITKLKQSRLSKMEKSVYPLLKLSYDYLVPTMKCCLLYCCLYPEDYPIPTKTLVEYWFCEGLFESDKISEAQMEGDHIINSLLRASLLERVDESFFGEECVKMHDVIRDMGLWIACEPEEEEKEKSFFVKAGAQLLEEPDVKAWEGAKRMSVMQNQIEDLGGTPKCPNLKTLFLSQNKLQVINDEMEEILSEGRLRDVADEVGNPYPTPFLNLQTLYLLFLPELKSIYWDALPFPCLKRIYIEDCPKLKKFPLNSDSAKGYHITIKGERDWWEQLEWENEATRNAFMPSFQEPFYRRNQL